METFQTQNGQPVRLQKVQIIQAAPGGSNIQTGTLNGQPVLLQIVHQTPKKRANPDESYISAVQVQNSSSSTNHQILDGGQPLEKRQRLARGGLRSCAKDVCDKVRDKGRTTYTEVANEIVAETVKSGDFDEKNIRRRVYDALNVLMALNIVHKERNKERTISWVGLPTNAPQNDRSHFHTEKSTLTRKVRQKEAMLRELLLQHVAFKRLIERNRKTEAKDGKPKSAVNLPFIVVNMARETEIDCSISEDQFEYHLKFSREFELHDELEILKRLGLADATNAENLLPPKLRHFLRLGQNYAKNATDKNSTISTTVSSTNSSKFGDQNSSQNNSDHQIELIEMSDSAKEVKLETNVSRSLFNE